MARLKLQGQGIIITADVEVTTSALAAGAEEELDIAIADAEVGDVLIVNPSVDLIEAGLSISYAYIDAAGSGKVGISNQSGSGLTGATADLHCVVISDRTV